MATDSHAPTPRGLLCNAGAGAAAGIFISFSPFTVSLCCRLSLNLWDFKLKDFASDLYLFVALVWMIEKRGVRGRGLILVSRLAREVIEMFSGILLQEFLLLRLFALWMLSRRDFRFMDCQTSVKVCPFFLFFDMQQLGYTLFCFYLPLSMHIAILSCIILLAIVGWLEGLYQIEMN